MCSHLRSQRNRTVIRKAALIAMLATLASCGSTGPENVVILRGTVVAAADGSGFTQGQPLPDARLTLVYTAPLTLTVVIRDTDMSDSAGAWEVQAGPPQGQTDPDCAQLTLGVIRAGFMTETVRLSSICGQGAGVFEGIEIEVMPTSPTS
jgi:hypothetical protein